ncbi:hypothetical protein [Phyllobacterium zundukense]|uniref:Uncharacterized protein n=1 Tax=Phyllobacterium zundukense TaxID=1867719 RepID=A0ACD4CXM4_9HYPH|nr:hypothetical protein [Phyllobacterium zundukense]UXN58203.1 hypothetical protein N8E88_05130 [Phyllobacterium zundukense]
MRNGYLQFDIHSRAGKLAQGAEKRMRASDIILGMTVIMLLVWLAAYAFLHLFAAA